MPDKDRHEAEKPAAPAPPAPAPVAATGGLSPADYMTEQEKDAANSAKQPYPTGDPPPPSETVIRGQGIKGVTDQPTAAPGEARAPAAASKPAPAKSDR